MRSPLLVVAVSGNIGSGASFVATKVDQALRTFGYDTLRIDVSTLIVALNEKAKLNALKELEASFNARFPDKASRVRELQRLGNALRETHGMSVLSDIIAKEIILEGEVPTEESLQKRKAYVIDSLKNPEEVKRLRQVFGDNFYLIGVVASEEKRRERLRERKQLDDATFDDLARIDANEEIPHGQHTRETILLSDYFFTNNGNSQDLIEPEASRFVKLIFQASVTTPRPDEFGMSLAFKAGASSACLSRQVGAAIFDKFGNVLATGCNDVPKFGGGLYGSADEKADKRCWTYGGKCYNDEEKTEIIDRIITELEKESLIDRKRLPDIEKCLKRSRIKNLIEFSRAVHAEMDAIISVARAGAKGLVHSTLYCTTYPCHNCAKHIVDAGVERVVYLEPYPKSLAAKLHQDSIIDSSASANGKHVRFEMYCGIAPKLYDALFSFGHEVNPRKNHKGAFINKDTKREGLYPALSEPIPAMIARIAGIFPNLTTLVESSDQPQPPKGADA